MRTKLLACSFLILAVACMPCFALAAEQFGVDVYPGAKEHPGATQFLKEGLGVQGTAFHTSDSVAAVVEFYRAQNGLREVIVSDESAMFRKGDEVDVTVQSPWMDMQSGALMQDCLISFVNRK
ncbi:hypothetical protein [Desulfonatronum thiodismutans]|uniref:hypothetical protein n=1 Tax=Desulfonatronum thiodismutans TaxID=159290 RepID=UPI0004ABED8C|nr:hypothetical protein [Desulfonatronum thiodismutans]